jgi:hypothetical protein
MPFTFPSNPATNDTYTLNGRVYTWNGSAWDLSLTYIPPASVSNVFCTITSDIYDLYSTSEGSDSLVSGIRSGNQMRANLTFTFTDANNAPILVNPFSADEVVVTNGTISGISPNAISSIFTSVFTMDTLEDFGSFQPTPKIAGGIRNGFNATIVLPKNSTISTAQYGSNYNQESNTAILNLYPFLTAVVEPPRNVGQYIFNSGTYTCNVRILPSDMGARITSGTGVNNFDISDMILSSTATGISNAATLGIVAGLRTFNVTVTSAAAGIATIYVNPLSFRDNARTSVFNQIGKKLKLYVAANTLNAIFFNYSSNFGASGIGNNTTVTYKVSPSVSFFTRNLMNTSNSIAISKFDATVGTISNFREATDDATSYLFDYTPPSNQEGNVTISVVGGYSYVGDTQTKNLRSGNITTSYATNSFTPNAINPGKDLLAAPDTTIIIQFNRNINTRNVQNIIVSSGATIYPILSNSVSSNTLTLGVDLPLNTAITVTVSANTANDFYNNFSVANTFQYTTTSTLIKEVIFNSPGTYSWTVPTSASNVSIVAVGPGGYTSVRGAYQTSAGDDYINTYRLNSAGGGGGLAYINDISVNQGDIYTVVVGSGRGDASSSLANTRVVSANGTIIVRAYQGSFAPQGNINYSSSSAGDVANTADQPGGSYDGISGVVGAVGGTGRNYGGGGAAGYLGNGGDGSNTAGVGTATVGSGGGAGGRINALISPGGIGLYGTTVGFAPDLNFTNAYVGAGQIGYGAGNRYAWSGEFAYSTINFDTTPDIPYDDLAGSSGAVRIIYNSSSTLRFPSNATL